jgi:hypothetical protein
MKHSGQSRRMESRGDLKHITFLDHVSHVEVFEFTTVVPRCSGGMSII